MPNLMSKARQNRLDAIAMLDARKTPRAFDAERMSQVSTAMLETGRRHAPLNIFV